MYIYMYIYICIYVYMCFFSLFFAGVAGGGGGGGRHLIPDRPEVRGFVRWRVPGRCNAVTTASTE